MICLVFGHVRRSLSEDFLFWGNIFCAISASDFRDGSALALSVFVSFSHGKGRLSGGGFSRQASFWLDGVMGHGTGRVRVSHG